MPRRTSRQNRNCTKNMTGTETLQHAIKDFNVHDYSRSTKNYTQNSLRTISKSTHECKKLIDDQDWYDKDLSDFDEPTIVDKELEPEEHALQPKQSQRTKQTSSNGNNSNGKDYPLDFWFVLAMYISPEDIGKFSLLCRASHYVVNTTYFWIKLFRRHNKIEANKIGGILANEHLSIIRTHVIKSLYQVYPFFRDRLKQVDIIQRDPHFLRLSRCVRIWYSKRLTTTQHESYNYYFEFRFDNGTQTKQKQQLQIQALSPLFQTNNQYIIEKDSYVLHLICSNFIPIGPYMGMILSHISLNLSGDYRHHKLKMWFDTSKLCLKTPKLYNDCVVIIDPLLCLKIYNWYNSPTSFD